MLATLTQSNIVVKNENKDYNVSRPVVLYYKIYDVQYVEKLEAKNAELEALLAKKDAEIKQLKTQLASMQSETHAQVKDTIASTSKKSLIECPVKEASQLYENRTEIDPETGKKINILQFLEKYYGQYLTYFNSDLEYDLLYQDQLGEFNPKALSALHSYFHNNKGLNEKASDYVKPKTIRSQNESKLASYKTLKALPYKDASRINLNKYRHNKSK